MKKIVAILTAVFQLHLMQTQTNHRILWTEIMALDDYKPRSPIPSLLETTGLSRSECGAKCSEDEDCASFFHNEDGSCLLYNSVFVTFTYLVRSDGYRYNEVVAEGCPIQECYHHFRQENLCLFWDKGHHNYDQSKMLCEAMGARLPILNTKAKNRIVRRFLDSNTRRTDSGLNLAFLNAFRQPPNGTFRWDGGELVAPANTNGSLWRPGQPVLSTELCIIMALSNSRKLEWKSFNCGQSALYVLCKRG